MAEFDEEIDFEAWLTPEAPEMTQGSEDVKIPKSGPVVLNPEIVPPDEKPPSLPAISTQEVAKRLVKYDKDVAAMIKQAQTVGVIQDETTKEIATTYGLQIKKLYNLLEALRKHFVAPHNQYCTTVNNFFKKYTEQLKSQEITLGRKIANFRALQETEKRKKEAEAREALRLQEEALQKEAAASAEKGVDYTPAPLEAPVIAPVSKVTRTDEGSASQDQRWVCLIEDPEKVPREYCQPVQKLLNEAVKNGVREIPGCVIKQDFKTKFRL